jgi:hypothetical protein
MAGRLTMAAVGDVLVKFVADFAEFSTNMSKSQREIESWSQSIAKAGQSMQGFMALAGRVAGALAIGEAVRQVIAFNNEMQKAGETLAAYSLRTDAAARSVRGLTDDSVKLAELYKTTGREWTEDYLARVTKAQQASEDFNNKSFVLGQRLHDLYLQLTQRPGEGGGLIEYSSQKANELFDWMEKLVPSVNRAVDVLANGFVIQLSATERGIRLLISATIDLVDWLGRTYKAAAVTGSQLEQMGRDAARARGYNTGPAGGGPTGAGGAFGMFDGPGATQSAAEATRRQQETQRQFGKGFGSIWGVPVSLAADGANAPPPAARGGGGVTDDDTVARQIARYKAMGEAADKAYKTINEGVNQNIEDLLRQVRAQQQADDITAKLIAKGQKVSDDQKKAIYDAVLSYEQKAAAEQKLIAVENAAVDTDKKYGDGTVTLTKLHKDLDDQLATHRITQTDYNRALKEGTEQAQQAALAATRYDDSLTSLAAGFESAANASARAHDMFSLGGDAFNALTGAMGEGIDALVGKSNKGFGQIAGDFALMLSKMAAQAALNQVFQYLLKAAGLFASGVTAAPGPAGGYNAGVNPDTGVGWIAPRASGGPVSAGTPYIVGERGPELFVPSAAGNIVPTAQTGGGGVTVNIDMNQTQGAANPSQALDFGRKVRAAVVAVIANEKRPGGTLHPATA